MGQVPSEPRHETGTASDLAVSDVPRATPSARAGDIRSLLAGQAFASATEIAVLDGERFVGIVPIERLLASPDDRRLGDLSEDSASVAPQDDLEAAARATARRGERSVAVVDAEGRFHGLVPPARLLQVVELEHEEDLARLGGFLSGASAARTASVEAVGQRLWHRLPWLGLGLVGAMASAVVVGRSKMRSASRFCSRSSCRRSSTWPTRWARRPRRSSSAGWRWGFPYERSSSESF